MPNVVLQQRILIQISRVPSDGTACNQVTPDGGVGNNFERLHAIILLECRDFVIQIRGHLHGVCSWRSCRTHCQGQCLFHLVINNEVRERAFAWKKAAICQGCLVCDGAVADGGKQKARDCLRGRAHRNAILLATLKIGDRPDEIACTVGFCGCQHKAAELQSKVVCPVDEYCLSNHFDHKLLAKAVINICEVPNFCVADSKLVHGVTDSDYPVHAVHKVGGSASDDSHGVDVPRSV